MTFEELKKIRAACLTHAEELLTVASSMTESHPHLAYHLSTLALEEIGKIIQVYIVMTPKPVQREEGWGNQDTENHVKKLFWALWMPESRSATLTPEHMQYCKDLARDIHETRLSGLYVNWKEGFLSIPNDVISEDQAKRLLQLAQVRLNLAKMGEPSEPSSEDSIILQWFQKTIYDDEKAKLILNKKAFNKLDEIKDVKLWMKWLKEQFEEAEREAEQSLNRELKRTEPEGEDRSTPKWKIKIRLFSQSHSIRQSPLSRWNSAVDWIKLYRGQNHTELFVELYLPKAVPLQSLWEVGWAEARRFVTVLNIGSCGFFWWQLPTDVSKFYVQMDDLDANCRINAERQPRLTLDWGRQVLDQTVLNRVASIYAQIPPSSDSSKGTTFAHYLTGITLMGKSDIHLRLELNAFLEFFKAFQSALQLYGDWLEGTSFKEAAKNMFVREFPDLYSWEELIDMGENLERGETLNNPITLTQVGGMKRSVDFYLLRVFSKSGDMATSSQEEGISEEN